MVFGTGGAAIGIPTESDMATQEEFGRIIDAAENFAMIQATRAISRRTVLRAGGRMALLGFCVAAGTASRSSSPLGRIFYVAPFGNDSDPGTSLSPFKSITGALAAVSDLGANDTIVVRPGTYKEQVVVNKGGDATGHLTLRSEVKHGAQIRSPGGTYAAVNIVKNYVVLDGFDVQAGGNGHGIEATFLDANPIYNGPHHIKILNNVCHNNAGSGIGVAYGDFYTIEGNICYDNCHTNKYQGSGISIYAARAISDQSPGFHNFVRNNICSWNIALTLPGHPEPPHSDGNGIIIDDLHNSQIGHPAGNYAFGTLVENNLVNNNGGKGIQVYLSDNVVIRNNTSYHNNRDRLNPYTRRGELSNVLASNNIWINNIAVADPRSNAFNTAIGTYETRKYVNLNVRWHNNLTFNGTPRQASLNVSRRNSGPTAKWPFNNLLGVDPQFINAGDHLIAPNFRLKADSRAVNAGTEAFGVAFTDLDGSQRIVGATIDIGAYELRG
jgi:hypothetical protein